MKKKLWIDSIERQIDKFIQGILAEGEGSVLVVSLNLLGQISSFLSLKYSSFYKTSSLNKEVDRTDLSQGGQPY